MFLEEGLSKSKVDDKYSIMDEIAQYEKDNPIDFNLIGKNMLKQADRSFRSSREMYRYKNQLKNITHDEIRDHVAKKVKKLFSLTLVEIESTLVKGRIDILEVDRNNRYVGIKIKKIAQTSELEQFNRYNNELCEKYGSDSKLIVLASRYTPDLLEVDLSGIQFWRYEIWWKIKTFKTKKDIYLIGIYNRLFEDKIQLKKQNSNRKR